MSRRVFFSAQELADLAKGRGLQCFPHTKRGVNLRANKEGWNDLPSNLCRKREGRTAGGGFEYHASVLPERMQALVCFSDTRAVQLKAQEVAVIADNRKIATVSEMSLSARQRTVMEARSSVLLAIKRYQTTTGASQATAIKDFLTAQVQQLAWNDATAKRDAGEALSHDELVRLQQLPFLQAAEGFGLEVKTLVTANDRPRGVAKVGRATLYGWIKSQSEMGVTGLAPAQTKEVQPVPPGFVDFLRYYAKPSKPDMTRALKKYNEELKDQSKALTIKQVRHTLKEKLNDIERNVGREGLLTLRSRLPYIQRTTDNLHPTTVYVADGKTLDAEIADFETLLPMKPELTSIMDVATRKLVGWAVSRKENAVAVTEALRNACCYHGIPAIFYTDRGAGYKNEHMDGDINGLMGRLSITKMHALPRNSQAKGNIERLNRTVWNAVAKDMATYLGKDMDKEAAEKVHKRTRADIKEFEQSPVLPSWDAFLAQCEIAVSDYNAAPHTALPKLIDPITGKRRHMSPNEAWDAHVADGFEPILVEDDIKDDLFRPYEVRTAHRGLVRWNTNDFFHEDLEAYHGEKVLVGYDCTQSNYVWVRELDRNTGQPGKLICVADYAGNKIAYVPVTHQKAAEEKRIKGQLSRVDAKRDAIEKQRSPQHAIERFHDLPVDLVGAPAAMVAPTSPATLTVVDADVAVSAPTPKPRRQSFATDEELALWALSNPEDLSPNQVRVLKDCLNSQNSRELFRMSGIDVEGLRTLLRAAA